MWTYLMVFEMDALMSKAGYVTVASVMDASAAYAGTYFKALGMKSYGLFDD